MKTTKRITGALLVFVLLLALCACAKEPEEQPWQNIMTYSTMGALSEQGFYYLERVYFLSYTDLASGQSAVLCSLPGCRHTDESCDAYLSIGRSRNMFFSGEHLYYFQSDDGTVHRRTAIGTEDAVIGTVAKEEIEEGNQVTMNKMAVAGRYLYYSADVSEKRYSGEPSVSENGITRTVILGRMDLTTGRDMVLIKQPSKEGWSLSGISLGAVREGGMLFMQCDGFQGEYKDDDFQDKSRKVTVRLQHWDAATGEVTTLLEKQRSELMQISMVYGDIVYFCGAGNGEGKALPLCTYHLKSGAVEVKADTDAISAWLCGPYATVLGRKLVNMETGEFLPRDGAAPIPVMSAAFGFVMMESVISEENPNEPKALEYYFIPMSALADGIQQADKTLVMTEEVNSGR